MYLPEYAFYATVLMMSVGLAVFLFGGRYDSILNYFGAFDKTHKTVGSFIKVYTFITLPWMFIIMFIAGIALIGFVNGNLLFVYYGGVLIFIFCVCTEIAFRWFWRRIGG
jgi:hypothetical protein